MSVTRRRLLVSTTAAAGSRLLPLTALPAFLAPAPAHAQVAEGIAIASAIAGMIAAHNRREGAMLPAMNEKLDLLIEQVASLQQGVSVVLDRLAALPAQFDDLLKENEARNTRLAVEAALASYGKLSRRFRRDYGSVDEFRRDAFVMAHVQDIADRLDQAMSTLQSMGEYGPTTALLVPSAIALERSLMILRGVAPAKVAGAMEEERFWFDKVLDLKEGKSVVSYKAAAEDRRSRFEADAAANSFGRAFGMRPGTVLYEGVGVNDYWGGIRSRLHHVPGTSGELDWDDPGEPPRHGPQERMIANATLTEVVVMVSAADAKAPQDVPAGFSKLVAKQEPPSGVFAATDPRIAGVPFRIQTLDLPDGAKREIVMRDMLAKSPRWSEFEAFQHLLAKIAVEKARITFAQTALDVMSDARRKFEASIDELRRA